MTQDNGTKTVFAIYSPPFIVDYFMFSGFENEKLARKAFKDIEEHGLVDTTRGIHLVRIDNLSNEQYELMTNHQGQIKPPEELREAVINHFDDYEVTKLDAYEDNGDEWSEGSLSAHGTLAEDEDYRISV